MRITPLKNFPQIIIFFPNILFIVHLEYKPKWRLWRPLLLYSFMYCTVEIHVHVGYSEPAVPSFKGFVGDVRNEGRLTISSSSIYIYSSIAGLRVGASLGLYSSYRGGRGGHPSTVPQYTKDHLKSIIFLPPDWPENDTTQMILDILSHRQRVSSSPVRADQI